MQRVVNNYKQKITYRDMAGAHAVRIGLAINSLQFLICILVLYFQIICYFSKPNLTKSNDGLLG